MKSERGPHPLIAIKELKISFEDDRIFQIQSLDPKAEAETLGTIRQLDHPHLIKAIATYRRGSKCYFIFPWADNGNLRDFWENNDSDSQMSSIRWVLEQLEGFYDALQKLHGRQCRHGDLKPENILCFKDEESFLGILVIADVGLAKIHMNPTQFREGGRGQ
jgi:serine/threonine protein kinase